MSSMKKQTSVIFDQTNSEAVIFTQDNQAIKVVAAPKNNLGYFQAIGVVADMHNKNQKTDIFTQLCKLSKPAFTLFNDLKNNRDPYTNLARLPVKKRTRSQQAMFYKRIA